MNKKIWWLASYPRSGNTWTRFLVEHYMTGEIPFGTKPRVIQGDNAMEFYDRVSPYKNGEIPDDINEFAQLRPAALRIMTSHWQLTGENLMRDIVMKTHNINMPFAGCESFNEVNTSGALVIARDPRDVAISYAKYLGKDVQWGVDCVCDHGMVSRGENHPPAPLGSWNDWYRSWAIEERFPVAVIRYEDLVEHPEPKLTMILRTLGVEDVNIDRVAGSVKACEMSRLQAKEKDGKFINHLGKNKFFRKGGSNWKGILSMKQINKILKHNGEMMEQLGYK